MINKLFSVLTTFILMSLISTTSSHAQEEIKLEDIWTNRELAAKRVPGFRFMNDGRHYTRLKDNSILKYDITTGDLSDKLIDGSALKSENFDGEIDSYLFSADEAYIILLTDKKSIYRRSYLAKAYLYNRAEESLIQIDEESIQVPTLSPDSKKIAFVKDNNIYIKNLISGDLIQVTKDGKKNKIINGHTDWVYEEEFSITKAFEWSPDGQTLAFLRFDETQVPEFTMTRYNDDLYPEYETFKYPKVGEKNASVSAHFYHLKSNKSQLISIGNLADMYIPRIKWTKDDDELCLFKMNRHQNELELLLVNRNSNQSSILLKENNPYYIDITDDLTFLDNGKEFIWTSEKDGYNHVYLYGMNGKLKKQLTKGEYDVTTFYGTDEKNRDVYFQAAKKTAREREIYRLNIKSGKSTKLSPKDGYNRAQFSNTFDFYVLNHSDINTPNEIAVFNRKKKEIRNLENNAELKQKLSNYGLSNIEFFDFTNRSGDLLNAWMIKPNDFDASKEYPVLMYVYGGPGSQEVLNEWFSSRFWWFQMLTQNGYIVACVDNRGTGGRGQEFKKMTYLELGKYETEDQIDGATYLGGLDYIDKERIGIFGWSYGGYMSSLCILKGNDVFKAAIAVAPVTSWKWYDTIYTERYMRTLKENESGYKDNSPVYFADQLKGSYLLVHGVADDNVHFQHTTEMANALIKANKQFDTYFYPNRNHGIYGDNARIHLYTKMTNFLYQNL